MNKEQLCNGGKTPEQIKKDLENALIPITGDSGAARKWIGGICNLALAIGGKATLVPSRPEEGILRLVFSGENCNNILVTLRPLSKNKE